jgi:hypothetical protein
MFESTTLKAEAYIVGSDQRVNGFTFPAANHLAEAIFMAERID